MEPWLKGLIIGELAAIPVILMILQNDKKSIIPILIMSGILGVGVAVAGAYFIA
jgi:hypothetical protein